MPVLLLMTSESSMRQSWPCTSLWKMISMGFGRSLISLSLGCSWRQRQRSRLSRSSCSFWRRNTVRKLVYETKLSTLGWLWCWTSVRSWWTSGPTIARCFRKTKKSRQVLDPADWREHHSGHLADHWDRSSWDDTHGAKTYDPILELYEKIWRPTWRIVEGNRDMLCCKNGKTQ